MKKVAIDLDGVIANTPDIISRELNRLGFQNRDNSKYEPKIKGIDNINQLIINIVDDIFYNHMNDIKPYRYINDMLFKEISYIADITILTARGKEFNILTFDWLGEHFPYSKFELVNKSSNEKPQFLKEYDYDCFVEDRFRTANEAAELGIDTFIINREWNIGRKTHKNVTRISHLSEFASILKSKYNI